MAALLLGTPGTIVKVQVNRVCCANVLLKCCQSVAHVLLTIVKVQVNRVGVQERMTFNVVRRLEQEEEGEEEEEEEDDLFVICIQRYYRGTQGACG